VIVLLLVATSSAGLGASETTRIDAVSYYGYADYGSQSIKKHSHLTGVYGYLGLGLRHLFEGEVDYTRITYRSRAVLRQWDYTLTYSNFSIRNWKFRVGGHYMTGQDPWADNAWLTIAGAHYYVPYKWDAGVDFYYSRYGKYEPQKLAIQQLTPHLGVNVWTNQRLTVRSDLRGYYIRLGEEVGLQDRDFYSGEARLSLYAGRWTYALFGWGGRQTFAVRNDGFTVFNLAEEHRGGYGGEIKFAFTQKAALTARVSHEKLKDFWWNDSTNSVTYVLMLGVTF